MANQYRSVLASGGASTGGDALPAEVLSGKTFTNDNGAQTGTMTNNGAITEALTFSQSYTVPEGYHNGSGTVTAPAKPALSSTKDTATGTTTINCSVGDIIILMSSSSTHYNATGATEIDSFATAGSDWLKYRLQATATTVTIGVASTYIVVTQS